MTSDRDALGHVLGVTPPTSDLSCPQTFSVHLFEVRTECDATSTAKGHYRRDAVDTPRR